MKITNIILSVLLALGAAAVGTLYYFQHQASGPSPVDQEEVKPPAAPQAEQQTHFPLPEADEAAGQLPPLPQSDSAMRSDLAELIGSSAFTRILRVKDIIRHIVVTIDNLPRQTVAERLRPTNPVPGKFRTTGDADNGLFMAPENAARYTPYVRAFESADTQKMIGVYVKFYPLFQEAYKNLGYPNDYFNDRLVAVIDNLLAAPEPAGPIALIQPRIVYQYDDLALEKSSAGQKVLIRMGIENELRVKAKLRDIRQALLNVAKSH
jgi:hypothetical protein